MRLLERRSTINAVHDGELRRVLRRLGFEEALAASAVKCAVCDRPVGHDNIGLLWPENGDYHLVCDDMQCIRRALTNTGVGR